MQDEKGKPAPKKLDECDGSGVIPTIPKAEHGQAYRSKRPAWEA